VLLQGRQRRDVRRLIDASGSPERALRKHTRNAGRLIAELLARCKAWEVTLLAAGEDGFPDRLAAIPDPPLLLYLQGDPRIFTKRAVAVVGARRASLLGRETAATLARTLSAAGIVVVSGLALGIDAAAHSGAIAVDNPDGSTIAILGSGLGCVAPVSNLPLARSILGHGGLIISEYPLHARAARHHFPERNRLISGLAEVVVVVEAGERSGSLITARLALEQGREVLAVPGAITQPNSRGVNRLLKQGAGLVDSAQDVLDALALTAPPAAPVSAGPDHAGLSPPAQWLLAQMHDVTVTPDQLCQTSGLAIAEVSVLIAELELGGFVARSAGGYIRRPW
jgi:DNA processing protein